MSSTPRVWDAGAAREWVAVPRQGDDKYSRGVLGVITGSTPYPGAAVLGVDAAMRTGVGMVRYVGPSAVTGAVLARRPEVVGGVGRVQAWLIGSGMDAQKRSPALADELGRAVREGVPCIIDAGALDLVGDATGPVVITPHFRELQRALAGHDSDATVDAIASDPPRWAQRGADLLGVTVLLKGATTWVAHPGSAVISVTDAPGWLATAGTGDVLGGVLGALVATHAREIETDAATAMPALAATAAWLHARAAELASGGGPITALDVAEDLPTTIAALLG